MNKIVKRLYFEIRLGGECVIKGEADEVEIQETKDIWKDPNDEFTVIIRGVGRLSRPMEDKKSTLY